MLPMVAAAAAPTAVAERQDESGSLATRQVLILLVLAIVVTPLAYIATLRFSFVYDDNTQIVANSTLHSWRYFPDYFTTHIWQYGHPEVVANYYRPLVQAWKLIHFKIFGLNPFWWHLSSVGVHAAVTFLVFRLARRLTRDTFVAWSSAILFGLHPAHIEDVAWISGVTDPLLTLLLIASLLCYIDGRQAAADSRLKHVLCLCMSVVLYCLATLTKDNALTFLGVIFVYEYVFSGHAAPPSRYHLSALKRYHSAIKRTVPYLVASGIYLVVRLEVLRGFAHAATSVSARSIILTSPSLLWFYLKSLIYPLNLSPFSDNPLVTRIGWTNFALPLLGVCAAAFLARRVAKGSRLASLLAALMILPIIPVLNISVFTAGDIAHDRFLYLPSVGFCILMGLGLRRLKRWGPNLFGEPGFQVASACAIAVTLGVLTVKQEQVWQNDITLFTRGVMTAPSNTGAANHLALALLKKGLSQEALDLLRWANARNPDHWVSGYNLGCLYYKLGQYAEAEKYFRHAVDLNPRSSRANFFLGLVLLNSGSLDAAESSIRRAIENGPVEGGFYYADGLVLEKEGRVSEALEAYKRELLVSPDQPDTLARIGTLEGAVASQSKGRQTADRGRDNLSHGDLSK